MTLRVLLDATSLPAKRAGVGHYLFGLIGELARRPDQLELHVAARARDAGEIRRHAPSAVVYPAPVGGRAGRIVWEQTVLPRLAGRIRPDVVHGPHYTIPLWGRGRGVVTFHDPTFFTDPDLHERSKVAYFTWMARRSAKRAVRMIAVSEYARRGAIEHAGAHPGRVDVVSLGVDHDRYRPDGDAEVDERLRAACGVRGRYFLWIGTVEPRKDLPTLVRAFAGLAGTAEDCVLVIAGQRGWKVQPFERAIRESGVAGRIVRPGYVSEEQKVALYRGGTALVYPSVAEGFGLQVVEAMACGCPVITTTGSAPEEVGGDAVELVPPRDASSLRDAMERVLGEGERARTLRERGLVRSAAFTWARTAAGTLETYRRAAGEVE
jgi:glycosyltransferase involved in cell wall biosynthesis